MKKCIYLLAIVMMAVLNQSCEPNLHIDGTVYGVVTDAATGEPILGCQIYLSRIIPECGTGVKRILPGGCVTPPGSYKPHDEEPAAPMMQTTDEEGRYKFNFVSAGEYIVYALADGYVMAEKMIDLRAETVGDVEDQAIVEVNFALEKVEEEPTQQNDVLINLAELGDSLYTICSVINSNAASSFYSVKESLDTIHQIMTRKGFVRFYEEANTSPKFQGGMLFYANGIQPNSSWFDEDMTSEISQLQENACILAIMYEKDVTNPMLIGLEAAYILPVTPEEDYMTLSKNLYDYYAATHPFQVGTNNQEEVQCYIWCADVTIGTDVLRFNDSDVLFASALQAGVMSPEEYEYEMSMAREDGWRKDFLELIEQPNFEVFEAIEGNHAEKGYSIAELVREKDYWSIFKCQGTMIVEGYWAGYELEYEPPMDIKTRIKRDITNKRKRILKSSKGSSTN